MAKNRDNEFEEEMRKADAAAYRAGLANEPGMESTSDFMKRTGTKASPPKATVGGNKIVTKEQMQKAGFDNLRDYLNAQRGLTRRGSKAAEKGPDTATLDRLAAKQRDEDKGPNKATLDRLARKQEEEEKGPSKADIDRMAKKFGTRAGEKGRDPSRYGKPVKLSELGFKKGGSVKVSGASKRADGCAVRGKTRGKMV